MANKCTNTELFIRKLHSVLIGIGINMALKLVLALFACVAVATCTIDTEAENFIVGGQTARQHQFPFLVSLRNAFNNGHFCGGAIISNRWILSAAHCTQQQNSRPQNVHVWAGAHGRTDGVRYPTDAIVNHPQYRGHPFFLNDICVLRTAQIIQFVQGRIVPARLPTQDYTDGQRHQVWIAGWGQTGVNIKNIFAFHLYSNSFRFFQHPNVGGRHTPQFLQFKSAITIARQECQQRLGNLGQLIQPNKLCTLSPAGLGTCMGDSGGPLINQIGAVVGVVSWGVPCGTASPDVFARTFPHLNFISGTTGVRPQ